MRRRCSAAWDAKAGRWGARQADSSGASGPSAPPCSLRAPLRRDRSAAVVGLARLQVGMLRARPGNQGSATSQGHAAIGRSHAGGDRRGEASDCAVANPGAAGPRGSGAGGVRSLARQVPTHGSGLPGPGPAGAARDLPERAARVRSAAAGARREGRASCSRELRCGSCHWSRSAGAPGPPGGVAALAAALSAGRRGGDRRSGPLGRAVVERGLRSARVGHRAVRRGPAAEDFAVSVRSGGPEVIGAVAASARDRVSLPFPSLP